MTTGSPQPKPVGQRPRCLYCARELAPQFRDLSMDVRGTDGMSWSDALRQWRKDNPGWHQWTGHYGRYDDDRFCGLNCGYKYAVAHTKPQK